MLSVFYRKGVKNYRISSQRCYIEHVYAAAVEMISQNMLKLNKNGTLVVVNE